MDNIRQELNQYLQNHSGPIHLAELVFEVQRLLQRLKLEIIQLRESESIPLEEAQTLLKGYQAKKSTLIDGKRTLSKKLLDQGEASLLTAFAGSKPDDLVKLLNNNLKEKIQSSDVLNKKISHQIELEKASLAREWLKRDEFGLIPRWNYAYDQFVNESNESLTKLLKESLDAQKKAISQQSEGEDIASASVEKLISDEYEDLRAQTIQDTLSFLSTAWETWTVLASIGLTGLISSNAAIPFLAALGGPTSCAIIAAAALGATYGKIRQSQQLNERRDEMIQSLSEYGINLIQESKRQADEFIKMQIGFLIGRVDDEIASLSNSISALENRLNTKEYTQQGKRRESLERLIRQCGDINASIESFHETLKKA